MSELHQAGDVVGGYVLEQRLGGGGFGSVWRARSEPDGRVVAIKLLTGRYATGDAGRLRAEVELLAASASSRSSHVVKVFGGGVTPTPYVVMEYVEGTDLARELERRNALPIAETLRIGAAVAEALAVLNDAAIVHRDVKPANVLIATDGTAKLADFGIAKIVGYDSVTATSQMPMSMAYAAPEVWEGHASHQSDIYALGALLYQCLTGKPPFNGTYAEIYRQHLTKEPDLARLPSETPPALRALIGASLAKDPSDRPQDGRAVAGLIEAAELELRPPVAVPAALRSPTKIGPWIIQESDPALPWTFRCVHETSGDPATIEVFSTDDLAFGQVLRNAVAANPRLVPFGAEPLIGTNRLLLRPGEAWHESPDGPFQFWVARLEAARVNGPDVVTTTILRRAASSLRAIIGEAASCGVTLSLDVSHLSIEPDGVIHVSRPGLPLFVDADIRDDALAFLRSLPLDDRSREIARLALTLDDIIDAEDRVEVAGVPVEPPLVFGVARELSADRPRDIDDSTIVVRNVQAASPPRADSLFAWPIAPSPDTAARAAREPRGISIAADSGNRRSRRGIIVAGAATMIVAAIATFFIAWWIGRDAGAPDMVRVPAGTFNFGTDNPSAENMASLVEPVWVAGFEMDRLEVTNEQYQVFLDAQPPRRPPDLVPVSYGPYAWSDGVYPKGTGRFPVVYVTWQNALDYCNWRGKRLPTEAEWERAARGDDDRAWPWGDAFGPTLLNFLNTDHTRSTLSTMPVGSFPNGASPYGALDMAGNVSEWTADDLVPAAGGEAPLFPPGTYKAARGGSWASSAEGTAAYVREWHTPETRSSGIGFRCARSGDAAHSSTPAKTATIDLNLGVTATDVADRTRTAQFLAIGATRDAATAALTQTAIPTDTKTSVPNATPTINALPDLVIGTPPNISNGKLFVTIINQGPGESIGNLVVAVFNAERTMLLGGATLPGFTLAAGRSIDIGTGYVIRGSETLALVVDPNGEIDEADNSNNSATVAVAVSGIPAIPTPGF